MKAKFKVGMRVRVVRPEHCGGHHRPGDTGVILAIDSQNSILVDDESLPEVGGRYYCQDDLEPES